MEVYVCLHVYRAEDGPTCIIIQALDEDPRKSRFTWLLNMDAKVNSCVLIFNFVNIRQLQTPVSFNLYNK